MIKPISIFHTFLILIIGISIQHSKKRIVYLQTCIGLHRPFQATMLGRLSKLLSLSAHNIYRIVCLYQNKLLTFNNVFTKYYQNKIC